MAKKKSLLGVIWVTVFVLLLIPGISFAGGAKEEEPVKEEAEKSLYGGRLTVGLLNSMETVGLGEPFDWMEMGCMYSILNYDSLSHYANLQEGSGMEWWPRLCQSYDVSEDNKVWTLHLVENAKFHDGVPVTAEDVVFTYEYWWKPYHPGIWTDYESIEAIDDYTVRLVMTEPLPPYPPPGDTWPTWGIIPKHIFEPYKDDVAQYPNTEAIGSGPFKLKEFVPGEYLWLVKNEDYWGEKPYIDELLFRVYANIETAIMALKSGEIDAYVEDEGIPPQAVEDLKAYPGVEVIEAPGNVHYIMGVNLHKDTPLRDVRIRKALAYGIDYDRIIDMLFLGYAERIDSFYFNSDRFHNPNLPKYDYNPEKAGKLLDEAGFTAFDEKGIRYNPDTGEKLEFENVVASDMIQAVKGALLMKESLEEVGIGLKIVSVDYNTMVSMTSHPEADQYELSGMGGTYPAPAPYGDWIWIRCYSPEPGQIGTAPLWNEPLYQNPVFDALYKSYMSETDQVAKKEKAYEMQRIIAEDLPWIYVAAPSYVFAYRPENFEGWVIAPGGGATWFNIWSYLKVHKK